jgi:hypothetical protein
MGRPRAAAGAAVLTIVCMTACQASLTTTPPITPVPPAAVGLALYFAPETTVAQVEDESARPLAIKLQHAVRDALEEAGFKLAATPEASGGLTVAIYISKLSNIHADLFIRGDEACGVHLNLARAGSFVVSVAPDVSCVSTSSYYGMLPKDAATSMVNALAHAPAFIAVAEGQRLAAPKQPTPPSTPAPLATEALGAEVLIH